MGFAQLAVPRFQRETNVGGSAAQVPAHAAKHTARGDRVGCEQADLLRAQIGQAAYASVFSVSVVSGAG